MTLSSQTKVGLTFGQIIAVIGLFGSLVYAWTDINVRVGRLEQQY